MGWDHISCVFANLEFLTLTTSQQAKGKSGKTGTFAASFFQLLLLHDRSGKDSTRLHSCNWLPCFNKPRESRNALQMECFYSSDFGEIISISLQTNISSGIEFFILKRSSKLNVDFQLETFGSRHLVACENMCYSAALYLDLVPMTVLYVMYCVLHCDLAKSHQTCHFFEKIGWLASATGRVGGYCWEELLHTDY